MDKIYKIFLIFILLSSQSSMAYDGAQLTNIPVAPIAEEKKSLVKTIEDWLFPDDSPAMKITHYIQSYFNKTEKKPVELAVEEKKVPNLSLPSIPQENTISNTETHSAVQENTQVDIHTEATANTAHILESVVPQTAQLPVSPEAETKKSLVKTIGDWLFPDDSPAMKITHYIQSYFNKTEKKPVELAVEEKKVPNLSLPSIPQENTISNTETHSAVQENTQVNIHTEATANTALTSESDAPQTAQLPVAQASVQPKDNVELHETDAKEQKTNIPVAPKLPDDLIAELVPVKHPNPTNEIAQNDTTVHDKLVTEPPVKQYQAPSEIADFQASTQELAAADSDLKEEIKEEHSLNAQTKAPEHISPHLAQEEKNNIKNLEQPKASIIPAHETKSAMDKTEHALEARIEENKNKGIIADLKPIDVKQMKAKEAELADIADFIQNEIAMILLPRDDVELGEVTMSSRLTYADDAIYIKVFWEQYDRKKSKEDNEGIKHFIKAIARGPVTIADIDEAKKELLIAAKNGDIYTIRAILNHSHININSVSEEFNPVLASVASDQYNSLYYFIMKGADISVLNSPDIIGQVQNESNAIIWLLSKAGAKVSY